MLMFSDQAARALGSVCIHNCAAQHQNKQGESEQNVAMARRMRRARRHHYHWAGAGLRGASRVPVSGPLCSRDGLYAIYVRARVPSVKG